MKNILIFLLFILNGCAIHTFNFDKEKDLVDKFEVEEEFSKFKVESPSAPSKEKEEIVEVKEKLTPKISKKKKPSKTPMIASKIESKVTSEKSNDFIYPEDYPEELKTMDKHSKALWASRENHLFIGETFKIKAYYIGVPVGHVEIKTNPVARINDKEVFHFSAHLKSSDYYNFIYALDDRIDSYVTEQDFLPVKYSLIQRESTQSVDDLQLFDQEALKTYLWYKKEKKGKSKQEKKSEYIPKYVLDSFSALFFARSLPLKVGQKYKYPVVTHGKTWILFMQVMAVEQIEVMGQKIESLRINAETHFTGVLKKQGDIVFWFSNDNERKLLKFEAKVKIGAVSGELSEYHPGLLFDSH